MKIAIIGGGFSALSLSLQIISKGSAPLSLYICERQENIGLGTAYSTKYTCHLLNVRAAQMGVSPDNPEGFYHWLQKNENIWRIVDPAFKELHIHNEAFLPRKLYGIYLSELLKELKATALRKGIHFEIIRKDAVNIEKTSDNKLCVIFSDNQHATDQEAARSSWPEAGRDALVTLPQHQHATDKAARSSRPEAGRDALVTLPQHQHATDQEAARSSWPEAGRDALVALDKVVLATGVQPIKKLPFSISSSRYIENLWKLDKQKLEQQLSSSTKDSTIFIIGTGLTMVDMVTSLDQLGYIGKIIALSRHGQLPATHPEHHLPPIGNLNNILDPKSLLDKLRAFRNELRDINLTKGHWVQLFETLRPVTTKLWKQLSFHDKKRFLRHCLPLWNKHRHRMPIESMQLIDKLQQKGRLKILSGKIIDIHNKNNILEIRYKHNNTIETIQADCVYNCTGPDYTLRNSSEPLIQNLLAQGFIIPDSLGLGIKCESNFHIDGPFSEHVYAIGSLLFGENFETTAIPDIRNQAQIIASQILLDT